MPIAPTPRRSLFSSRTFKCLAGLVAGSALLILVWDWNWFRPMIERRASAMLGRDVKLAHVDVRLSMHPLLIFEQVSVANPKDFADAGPMAVADRLQVRIDLRRLVHQSLKLDELIVERPLLELRRGTDGVGNWVFPFMSQPTNPDAGPGPEIASMTIDDGNAHLLDKTLKSDFKVKVHTQVPASGGEAQLFATIGGTYNGQPITGRFTGGSILTLRDKERPYAVDLELTNGATQVGAKGTMLRPLSFGDADVRLSLKGADLADLYALTAVPLPHTARYKLDGMLDYRAGSFRFTRVVGVVGKSDLSGEVAVTPARGGRSQVTAKLTSKKLVMADLGGFIGAKPGQAEPVRRAGRTMLLPDVPLSLPKLRSTDVHVHFTGQRIDGKSMPLDNMVAQLDIVDGRIGLKPLSFKVGTGQIVINLALDAQQDLVKAAGNIDFRRLELAHIMEKMTIFKGGGTIAGHARIDSSGNSLADLLGRGNGELQLFTAGGDLSSVLVDLAGLNFGSALLSALGLPNRTTLRCAIADYELKQGVLGTRLLVVDTSAANILGEGSINLRDEQIDYRIRTEPKRASIGSFRGPVVITGPLRSPKIRPDMQPLVTRGGAAAGLAVLLGPLGALLPTIQLGLGKDSNCNKLVDAARKAAGQTAVEGKADAARKHAPRAAPEKSNAVPAAKQKDNLKRL